MAQRRLLIEMGMGVDQHGQDPTVAAARAVHDAIAHNALPGLWEVAGLTDAEDATIDVQIGVPYPEQVRRDEVLAVLPFGRKVLTVEAGGMIARGWKMESFDDKTDEILIAVAAITVLVDSPQG